MKKRLVAAACVLLFFCFALPARAETVPTGQWVEFGFSICTEESVDRHVGDTVFRYSGEGFDSAVVRIENFEGRNRILLGEYEGELPSMPGDGEVVFPAEECPYDQFLVTLEWDVGGEKLGYSLTFFTPDLIRSRVEDPPSDLTPPQISVSPVADRMLVNASDEGGFFAVGQDLAFLERYNRSFGSSYDPYCRGNSRVTIVSDPIRYNGDWAYSFQAYDEVGNSSSRTVFLRTSGIGDMPDSVLNAPVVEPHETAPNTVDPSLTFTAVVFAASLALLTLRRTRSRKGSR